MKSLDQPELLRLIRTSVAKTVAREVRLVGLAGTPQPLPPPHDIDAEAEVLSAVLCGHVTPSWLAPLGGPHFYSRFNRAVFEAAAKLDAVKKEATLAAVSRELAALGVQGPVDVELRMLRDSQPFVSRDELRDRAVRLVELWRQRRLIRAMQGIDLSLRTGASDSSGAARALWSELEGLWR